MVLPANSKAIQVSHAQILMGSAGEFIVYVNGHPSSSLGIEMGTGLNPMSILLEEKFFSRETVLGIAEIDHGQSGGKIMASYGLVVTLDNGVTRTYLSSEVEEHDAWLNPDGSHPKPSDWVEAWSNPHHEVKTPPWLKGKMIISLKPTIKNLDAAFVGDIKARFLTCTKKGKSPGKGAVQYFRRRLVLW